MNPDSQPVERDAPDREFDADYTVMHEFTVRRCRRGHFHVPSPDGACPQCKLDHIRSIIDTAERERSGDEMQVRRSQLERLRSLVTDQRKMATNRCIEAEGMLDRMLDGKA